MRSLTDHADDDSDDNVSLYLLQQRRRMENAKENDNIDNVQRNTISLLEDVAPFE